MPPSLSPADFPSFFQCLHEHAPFRWQTRLADRACAGDWPDFIKLPTSSGKTACLDIAVFALACQAAHSQLSQQPLSAPRRIFFVVDRRVIVNEAFQRATYICNKLEEAVDDEASPLHPVAWWLRSLTQHHSAPPLDCFELRGGIYRDDAWVRSVLQPTILTSTVDQIGSRLLFRGYGVSDRNLPIHAALTANDSLIILDEAHCSQPFSQTLQAIARYRDAGQNGDQQPRWSGDAIRTPFVFTQMTATPDPGTAPESVFELEAADYDADQPLRQRHTCAKPVRLIESSAKGTRQNVLLARTLATEAELLATNQNDNTPACRRIAVVVNRVACARETYELLTRKHPGRVQLMIGRMRPIDRDQLTEHLQQHFRSDPTRQDTDATDEPHFVVATQCLEVGADLDFDGMVSQCASLSALRQRFGRLNRLGQSAHARGTVVMAAGDINPKKPDPIYDDALPNTWQWLNEHADTSEDGEAATFDFGIQAMDLHTDHTAVAGLDTKSVNAPILLPAHLDLLCQTSGRPAVEPNIATFLHGPERGQAEVRVCWRADLPEPVGDLRQADKWAQAVREVVGVCPPTSAEVLSVPLQIFRMWLTGESPDDDTGDLLSEQVPEDSGNHTTDRSKMSLRQGIIWTGQTDRAILVSAATARNLRMDDTIVLPVSAGGWLQFGHIPDAPAELQRDEQPDAEHRYQLAAVDVADQAFQQARNRCILRIHSNLATTAADTEVLKVMTRFVLPDEGGTARDVLWAPEEESGAEVQIQPVTTDDLTSQSTSVSGSVSERRIRLRDAYCQNDQSNANAMRLVRYPNGLALIGPHEPQQKQRRELPRAGFDDDFDEHNMDADRCLPLADHLADVAEETRRLATALSLDTKLADALVAAAERHDLGKADPRFQAMLRKSMPFVTQSQPKLWAKSNLGVSARHTAGEPDSYSLPTGFRHEMLSVQFAQRIEDNLNDEQRLVVLHTIAAHHGHARPFAPVVEDDQAAEYPVSLEKLFPGGDKIVLSGEDRILTPPAHRLDSGIASRFWQVTRRYGWWGAAWLETALRLSDWTASAQPRTDRPFVPFKPHVQGTPAGPSPFELPCPGIDGSNPLGFLAALGLLRTLDAVLGQSVKLKWQTQSGWIPVFELDSQLTESEVAQLLHAELHNRQDAPHFNDLGKNTTVPQSEFRQVLASALKDASADNRTTVDFYAAFGSDGLVSENDGQTIQDTALRTMAGAGHQHFLETMSNVIATCEPEHLQKTLFDLWTYDDPTQTLSLRFDPLDDNRYALQWRNPSGDPDRKKRGSMLGANRLAIEAIPFFTTAPGTRHLQTTGFRGHRSSDTFFSWPIWTVPLTSRVIQSLLASTELATQATLFERGVACVFRSQRITVGKVRNFTPATMLSRPATATVRG